jgi:hypothetical protein
VKNLLRRAATVAPLKGWALLGGVYLTAMVLNVWRVWHFGPDTRFYLAWAYRFGGLSEAEAGKRSYDFFNQFDWFAPFCWNACDTSDPGITYSWLFRGEEGGLFAQRILYPLLSAPFARLFGPVGMLVVPVIAYTACVILVVILASRLFGPRWAVLAGLATVVPISITAFGLYAYTEALAMALMMACVIMLPLGRTTRPVRRDLIIFAGLLALFAFTRQFHMVLVLGIACAWLGVALGRRTQVGRRDWRNEWAPFLLVGAGVTVVVGIIQTLLAPGYGVVKPFLEVSGAGTIGGIPGVLPSVIGRIVAGEVDTGGRDFGLVLVAVLGACGLIRLWRTELAKLTAGVLVGTFGLELITALPSNNRYWALSVPLLALLTTGLVASIFAERPVTRLPTESDDVAHVQGLESPTPDTGSDALASADLPAAMMPAPPR